MPALISSISQYSSLTTHHTIKAILPSTATEAGVTWSTPTRQHFDPSWCHRPHHHHHNADVTAVHTLPSTLVTTTSGKAHVTTLPPSYGLLPPLSVRDSVPRPPLHQAEVAYAHVTRLHTGLHSLSHQLKTWNGREDEKRVKILRHIVHDKDLALELISSCGTAPSAKHESCTGSLFNIALCILSDLENAERFVRAGSHEQARELEKDLRKLSEHLLWYCGRHTGAPPHATALGGPESGPTSTWGPPLRFDTATNVIPPSSYLPTSCASAASCTSHDSDIAPASSVVSIPTLTSRPKSEPHSGSELTSSSAPTIGSDYSPGSSQEESNPTIVAQSSFAPSSIPTSSVPGRAHSGDHSI